MSPPKAGSTKGGTMTVRRMITITAVVSAAIGMTTQVEAAKRKPTGTTTFIGCAYVELFCGPVMRDAAGKVYVFNPPIAPYTPLKVVGRKSGVVPIGCWGATRVDVKSVTPLSGQSCAVSVR